MAGKYTLTFGKVPAAKRGRKSGDVQKTVQEFLDSKQPAAKVGQEDKSKPGGVRNSFAQAIKSMKLKNVKVVTRTPMNDTEVWLMKVA